MGFRFRKSINFGIFRVNASKTGLGWSVGIPGARYTKMANGRSRATACIPGTGLSWVEETKKPEPEPQEKKSGWETAIEIICKVIVGVAIACAVGFVCLLFAGVAASGGKK